MALIHCNFFSFVLEVETTMCVAYPEFVEEPIGVLYLLHGLNENDTFWSREAAIDRYSREHNIIIIMPDAGKSYYTNMIGGEKYLDFIGEELPKVVKKFFKITDDPRKTFVAGFSMGGYGAFKTGLTYPEKFAGMASLSGVLEIEKSGRVGTKLFEDIFGKGNPLVGTEHDLKYLLSELDRKNVKIPEMLQGCGADDIQQIGCNRSFAEFCKSIKGLRYEYFESPGYHDYSFRIPGIERVISWIDKKLKEELEAK